MNPSVQDFVKAIDSVAADQVIVMPNDRNIMLAAQHASTLTQKQVRVVPSVTIPQGIAALMAYNFQANLDANAEAMKRALNTVHTGELTRAVRTVSIDGVDVREGQIIGLNNGKLTIAGDELNSVALDVMRRMNVEQSEIVTVYYGQEVSVAAAQQLAAQIRAHFNHLEVELVSGGQPHMHYILSAE
jgi:dihydroxyacetone kinase-like predicted kinase